uniref:Uncharacterized protein n=1 Tax=Pyramimonas obovata TaxID=1411642 RepID=A0A7S0WR38_9CHLO|mmetsp:Transcript_35815/g.78197  ORF Transcript_35815/g.78197 Transcript_35815/m.78197 type:complete len:121 (+) Transcript_35815:166-528(+)
MLGFAWLRPEPARPINFMLVDMMESFRLLKLDPVLATLKLPPPALSSPTLPLRLSRLSRSGSASPAGFPAPLRGVRGRVLEDPLDTVLASAGLESADCDFFRGEPERSFCMGLPLLIRGL